MAQLSHLDEQGRARMVDVSDKEITSRVAVARGTVRMQPKTLRADSQTAKSKKAMCSPLPGSPASWPRRKPPN